MSGRRSNCRASSGDYLYRVLRDDEDVSGGITARSPSGNCSVYDHVSNGSYNTKGSQYISTSASRESAESFARMSRDYSTHGKSIAKINTQKLGNDVQYVDLTNPGTRNGYFPERDFAHNCANKFDEVLVTGKIPASSIEDVYRVQPDGPPTGHHSSSRYYNNY